MRAIFIIGFLLTLFLIFTACEEGTTPTAGNTPAQVLRSLIYAFNNRDIEMLDRALSDDFTFHFDEDDVGTGPGDYIIPETWGRGEFLEAAGSMLEQSNYILMDINTSNVGTPDEDSTVYFAGDVEVRLLVMIDAVNGYLADGVCDFEFVNTGSGGTDNWVIRNWQDYTWPSGSGGRNINHASVGFILAVFR